MLKGRGSHRLLFVLLLACFFWATTISVLYWRIKNNPRVIAVTTDAGKSLFVEEQSEVGKITFLRQYLDRYFNYDSQNFWQSQTSLAFLTTPKLREERVREVQRLREKIQQKNLSQKARLRSLILVPNDTYEAQLVLLTKNDQENSAPETLFVTMTLKLKNTERTLENPWGLLVSEISFATSPETAETDRFTNLALNIPTIISLPCPLKSLDNSREKTLLTKITTLNTSELQITATEPLQGPTKITGFCKDREYALEITTSAPNKNLFLEIPADAGKPFKNSPSKRKKDVYERTIEKVLGIELEN